MLCKRCKSIHFRLQCELPQEQKAMVPDEKNREDEEEEEYDRFAEAYYVVQDSFLALRQSQATCTICRKIWDGLSMSKSFHEATLLSCPVYMSMRIWLTPKPEEVLSDIIFYRNPVAVHCSTLKIWMALAEDISGTVQAYLENLGSITDSDTTTLSNKNMELAHIWLQHCRDHHQPCNQLAKPGPAPLHLIDISDPEKPFLVSGKDVTAPYATLSYKWGHTTKYLTTSKNFSQHQEKIPVTKLPKTFKEAFDVARILGFSHFWTDALCIRHDVSEELREQIEEMGKVYSSSTLTIFAAAGNDPNSGLRVDRDGTLIKPSVVRITVSVKNCHLEHLGYMCCADGNSYEPQQEFPLSKRGWVLQEECLSARGLWFESSRMSWDCLCEAATESNPGLTAVKRISEGSDLQSFVQGRHVTTKMRYRLRESAENPLQEPFWFPLRNAALDSWYQLLENYTARELTNASDVLPALSGLASKFSKAYNVQFVAGLWKEDLQFGLLWGRQVSGVGRDHTDSCIQYGKSRFYENLPESLLVQDSASQGGRDDRFSKWGSTSGLDDNGDDAVDTCRATFSWIHHYLSGKRIEYSHYRMSSYYTFETDLGIQILDITINQAPMYKNIFGEILSASLTVRARVKKALLAERDVLCVECSSYRLIDEHDSRFKGQYVAVLYPDSANMIERLGVIHCVLCAAAQAHGSRYYESEGRKLFMCIGVVPARAPGQSNQFVRVGFVNVLDKRWFESCFSNEPDEYMDVQEFELM